MAHIRRLATGRWQAQIRLKGHAPASESFDTKALAREWATKTEAAMRRGEHDDARELRQTLAKLLDWYLEDITPRKRSQATEESQIRRLRADLGHHTLAGLSVDAVLAWVDERGEQVSGSSVRKELNLLSNVLRLARAIKRLPLRENVAATARDILSATKALAPGRSRDRRPTDDELTALREHGAKVWPLLPALIDYAIETAMRRGEIVAQRREHRRGALLDIPETKTTARTIPLSPRAQAILDGLPKRLDGMTWPPLHPDTLSDHFATACKRAGITDLRFHDLRHEAASRLFERGLSVAEVASITGHRDWRVLRRYTQIRPEATARKLAT